MSDSVLSGYPNTEIGVEITARVVVFFCEFQGFWIADETPSRVFDESCQTKKSYGVDGEIKS